MHLYDAATATVDAREVVEALHTLLAADSALETLLGGSGRIYAHRFTADTPDGPWGPDAFWARGRVAEPSTEGGRLLPATLQEWMPVQVLFEVPRLEDGGYEPDLLLKRMHARARAVLVGQTPSIGSGTVLATEQETRPTGAIYHDHTNTYYSACTYRVTVQP